jgi:tRNA dimethylallyltransferase
MYESPSTDDQIKYEATELLKTKGIAPIIDFLKINDPEVLNYLHENDHYRLVRAYEHFRSTGTKISEQKKMLDNNDPYDFNKISHPWDILHFYLDLDKELHQNLIRKRTEQMFQLGLETEVRDLLDKGFDPQLKPLQSIGYKETIDYIRGNYSTLEMCIERIVISTRQLAKSQRTFFKKIHPKIEINPLRDQQKILEITQSFI